MYFNAGNGGAERRCLDVVQTLSAAADEDDLASHPFGVEIQFQYLPRRNKSLIDMTGVMEQQHAFGCCQHTTEPTLTSTIPVCAPNESLAAGPRRFDNIGGCTLGNPQCFHGKGWHSLPAVTKKHRCPSDNVVAIRNVVHSPISDGRLFQHRKRANGARKIPQKDQRIVARRSNAVLCRRRRRDALVSQQGVCRNGGYPPAWTPPVRRRNPARGKAHCSILHFQRPWPKKFCKFFGEMRSGSEKRISKATVAAPSFGQPIYQPCHFRPWPGPLA